MKSLVRLAQMRKNQKWRLDARRKHKGTEKAEETETED
jgi:hypothetical protein